MKVLHIVTGLTKANGVSVFLCELAAEQVSLGHDVSILVKSLGDDVYPIDSKVGVSGPGQEYLLSDFDVVHVHALWDPWLTRIAKAARRAGCKIVWSPHGMLTPWALKNKWPKKILGLALYQYWSLRGADLIHVTALSEVEDVRRLRFTNPLVVAPLGVRVGRVEMVKCREERILLFVSRIQRKKGLPNLLEAWARLPDNLRKGWVVKIAGPDQDNHTEELREQCQRLGIVGEVQFLGPVFGEAKTQHYRDADLFVLPTHSENFGSVVIEALAEGTPVICTKGAPWEELETANCGRWIEIGVEPLRAALSELMGLSDAQRAEMGARGRKLVEEKYTWSAVAKTILASYEELTR